MKIESNSLTGLRIVPESDSDRHIMEAWTKCAATIFSSGVHCDFPGCSGITIGFIPTQTRDAIPKSRTDHARANFAYWKAEYFSDSDGVAWEAYREAERILYLVENKVPRGTTCSHRHD